LTYETRELKIDSELMDSTFYDNGKLKAAREMRQQSQVAVSRALGVTSMTIQRAEAGKHVSFRVIAELCNYYGIPVTSIIHPHPDLAAA
jgi:transcriptional regulator with XRE-family HTH domain